MSLFRGVLFTIYIPEPVFVFLITLFIYLETGFLSPTPPPRLCVCVAQAGLTLVAVLHSLPECVTSMHPLSL